MEGFNVKLADINPMTKEEKKILKSLKSDYKKANKSVKQTAVKA